MVPWNYDLVSELTLYLIKHQNITSYHDYDFRFYNSDAISIAILES